MYSPAVRQHALNPLRFGGQVGYYRDIASRLYVRARHLRSGLGRWMNRDTMLSGYDLYTYADANPVIQTDPTGLLSVTGRITCDDPKELICTNTWCDQVEYVKYANVSCNFWPCRKACPVYQAGMTGSFPNLLLAEDRHIKECCKNGKWARSSCVLLKHWHYKPNLNVFAICGGSLTVVKGNCNISIRIIDAGPYTTINSIMDLHPEAAKAFWKCLKPGKPWPGCGNFAVEGVTIHG